MPSREVAVRPRYLPLAAALLVIAGTGVIADTATVVKVVDGDTLEDQSGRVGWRRSG